MRDKTKLGQSTVQFKILLAKTPDEKENKFLSASSTSFVYVFSSKCSPLALTHAARPCAPLHMVWRYLINKQS